MTMMRATAAAAAAEAAEAAAKAAATIIGAGFCFCLGVDVQQFPLLGHGVTCAKNEKTE